MLRGKLFLISVAVLFQAASISFGDLLLDQAHDPEPPDIGVALYQGVGHWQEFRPTMNSLEQVDFYLEKNETPEGELVSFQLRSDDNTTIWSTSFSADILPDYGWFVLDTPQISLIPEQTYRLYLTSNTPYNNQGMFMPIWNGTTGNLYDRGDCSFQTLPGVDLGFRTWAVPEPATLLLLGLGGLGLRRKRKA